MGLKFKKTEHNPFERDLYVTNDDGMELRATAAHDADGPYFLFLSTEPGNIVGLTREEALQFAAGIIREATR